MGAPQALSPVLCSRSVSRSLSPAGDQLGKAFLSPAPACPARADRAFLDPGGQFQEGKSFPETPPLAAVFETWSTGVN